ncbi:DNA-binding NarL/FixJ family response regulator [Pedobacter sp. AK013]|uniref:response regulator transcription factor n=1 Tax=Pedobacter sp. AK013 TaxID=2723071 RepID=UPI001609438B|nr:response regulator transcription factor [Pedobacter sp. AK013]MBB6239770.1 DNA-binding NarL/FixJ family response regulator [Pedobacter sp. AK013]
MLKPKPTLVLADDHPIIIEGLTKLLGKNEGFEIIASFTNGQDLLTYIKKNPVNITLIDIILPDINGMILCKEIKRIAPDTIVIALSNHLERSAITKMLENGANGYILKDASIDEIGNCINEALEGKITFSKGVTDVITKSPSKTKWGLIKLTSRESEILKLVAQGLTASKIAEILFLSKFTVDNHKKNLLQKLHAKNIAELISNATGQGLL